jgi:hypothetical protein
MARVVCVVSRTAAQPPLPAGVLRRVCSLLLPEELPDAPVRIAQRPGLQLGITMPTPALRVHGTSVCAGAMFEQAPDWWLPGAPVPDGSYALFRSDEDTLELVSDALGSRTLWYAKTRDLFVASTSQRAIVAVLRSFEPDSQATAWMISSGTLGPGLSWDRRISCVPPDGRLALDRRAWTLRVQVQAPVFTPRGWPPAEQRAQLWQAIKAAVEGLDIDPAHWLLPLSGGYDSRALLLAFLQRGVVPDTVTWGQQAALERRDSDAATATRLARHFGLPHRYLTTDTRGDVGDTLRRFVQAADGRSDRLSGYMDGLAIWRELYAAGCHGVIRGDVPFTSDMPHDGLAPRLESGLRLLCDHPGLAPEYLAELAAQHLPRVYARREGESLQLWKDRLYHSFEVPAVLAPLNELKAAYVEVVNPLLSRRMIELVRQLPDTARMGKRLFKQVVRTHGPQLPFAKRAAIQSRGHIIRSPAVRDLIMAELLAASSSTLPPELVALLRTRFDSPAGRGAPRARSVLREALSSLLPAGARATLKNSQRRLTGPRVETSTDWPLLAFRACIVEMAERMLRADAAAWPEAAMPEVGTAAGADATAAAGMQAMAKSTHPIRQATPDRPAGSDDRLAGSTFLPLDGRSLLP